MKEEDKTSQYQDEDGNWHKGRRGVGDRRQRPPTQTGSEMYMDESGKWKVDGRKIPDRRHAPDIDTPAA